jgi:hypothetical protein
VKVKAFAFFVVLPTGSAIVTLAIAGETPAR